MVPDLSTGTDIFIQAVGPLNPSNATKSKGDHISGLNHSAHNYNEKVHTENLTGI